MFRSTVDVVRDPLRLMARLRAEYGDVVRFRLGNQVLFLISHPDDVRHILHDNHRNYVKSRNYDPVRRVLGDGLLTLEGQEWRERRKLDQAAFHRQQLEGFAEAMVGATRAMLDSWSAAASGERRLDLYWEMKLLTFEIVAATLLSGEVEMDLDRLARELSAALDYTRSIPAILGVPLWVPLPRHARFKRARRAVDDVVRRIVEHRRRHPREAGDLLSLLMNARDPVSGQGLSALELRDEIVTMVLAGHDTSVALLSWALHLMASHADCARRVSEEVDAVLGGRPPGVADLPRLDYTDRLLQEALRLYPPGWIIERASLEPDVLGGHAIPAHSTVMICTYALHRDPRFWDDPDAFDPDRFTVERSAKRPRHAFVPFGAGPRVCVGRAFGMMEAKIILASIAQRYRLKPVAGHRVEPDPKVTLRPRSGVCVTIEPR